MAQVATTSDTGLVRKRPSPKKFGVEKTKARKRMRDSGGSGIARQVTGTETLQGGNAKGKVNAGTAEAPSSLRAAGSAAEPLGQTCHPDRT